MKDLLLCVLAFILTMRLLASDGYLSTLSGTTLLSATPAASTYLVASNGTTTLADCGQSVSYLTVTNGTTTAGTCVINPNNALPAGMRFRYKASNLSSTPVSDWIDSISSFHWTATGTARPAWDANGVTFNGSANVLTATNGNILESDGALLLVFKMNSTSASQMLLDNSYSSGNILVGMDTANYFYDASSVSAAVGPIGTAIMDLINVRTNVNYGAYTNGIFGGKLQNQPQLTRVGSGSGNAFASFILKEMIYWTNQGVWSSATVSNVHWYSTNTYSYSP